MGAVGSGASNIGGRRDSQSITWEHSGGDGDLGAAVGLGSGVKRWATAEREQVESGARRARSVGPTDAQIEIRWVQRRRRLGSGDDGEGVTKAPQKKGCRRQRKSRAGRARTGQITVQSRASRESRSSEKPKIDVERGRAKSANRHGQRTVSTRSMRKEVQDQGERKMSRAA